ncbi:four helix bundle protein [Microscilla marina]|uniref:S23 ribosomal n=1 Tax=Microscilla marina ATCC 23134 TaxID=313606 RepID=A1ZFA9_MICM2|nr:four helix bundle protein [Microscilla marina]EAY30683.1 S23 ribosomal [Microscilla marina ATCC 23134]
MAFKFENLKVWQRALDYTLAIHEVTLGFPKSELSILTRQVKRATDSIALNIAEGSTNQSNAEFGRFLGYAARSGIEVVSCLHIAKKRNLIDQSKFEELYNEITEIIKMIYGLKRSIAGSQ